MHELMKNEEGLSIIELLVSLSVLLITTTAVMSLVVAGIRISEDAERFMVATKALEAAMEKVVRADFDDITSDFPDGHEESIELLGNRQVGQQGQARWVVTYPDTGNSNLLNIRITAHWQGGDGRDHSLVLSTLKSRRSDQE
jgi:type II secretory pathway pseudopilin PulG